MSKGKEKNALWAAEFLVVGAADVVVAGDVEAGIGGVECGFNGVTDLVVRYEKSLESSIITWASRYSTQFFPVRLHLWHMKVDNVTFYAFSLHLDSDFSLKLRIQAWYIHILSANLSTFTRLYLTLSGFKRFPEGIFP